MRYSRDPTLLAPHKISLWDTRLCVLGWDIDTVAMTFSVPLEKLERLRDTLNEWSPDRVVASEEELRSLIGQLLHLCKVVRPGEYFVRRRLNQVGLPPLARGALSTTHRTRAQRRLRGSTWVPSSTPTRRFGAC